MDERDGPRAAGSAAPHLLLCDYGHLFESFWKNEQTGETRISIFIGIATAVLGGLVTLATRQHGLAGDALRFVMIGGLTMLLALGVVTLARLLQRNRTTDEYKRGLDTVRQTIKDHFDPDGALHAYYPVGGPRFSAGPADRLRGEPHLREGDVRWDADPDLRQFLADPKVLQAREKMNAP